MISDKINQWTLLVGMLPLAMSVGAGAWTSLPLDARQHEEFFLTAAQSLFGVALLLQLRFSLLSALVLSALFSVQLVIYFVFRNDPARAIESLTMLGWLYLALAAIIFAFGIPSAWRAAFQPRAAIDKKKLPTAARAGSGPAHAAPKA
ncbi:MAG: hypothetical protein Q8R67_22495 [Rhodoferax sp.]|nr:hypothetical protein [Rhodoferax sp.]MDP3654443.1 hypothetical protein [Rhodoferax sp.]